MTITEAAQLVIQEHYPRWRCFHIRYGSAYKIYDLAVRMVELSGLAVKDKLNKKGDIEIQIIGLRPGENYMKNYYYQQLSTTKIQKFLGLKNHLEYSKQKKKLIP